MKPLVLGWVAACLMGCASTASPESAGERPPSPALAADPTATAIASNTAGVPAPSPSAKADPTATHEAGAADSARYGWLAEHAKIRNLDVAFPPPAGFTRITEADGSFGAWLRELPLRPPSTPVLTFSGTVLRQPDDPRIAAVAELDVGTGDLQQCADSVIRLHAEWKWSKGGKDDIGYHFLSGDLATYRMYASGQRPAVDGKKVVWRTQAKPSDSHATFRSYLDVVFNYASTISLALHTDPIAKSDVMPGDFFILPGGPGHTVLILDVATDARGKRVALLGQGYMPAQDFQVLDAHSETTGAWFSLEESAVDTPFWVPFPWSSLHRFGSGESAHPPNGR